MDNAEENRIGEERKHPLTGEDDVLIYENEEDEDGIIKQTWTSGIDCRKKDPK